MRTDTAPSYFFDSREVCFSFVIDCSVDEAGHCLVYEVQSTASENWCNALNPEETKTKFHQKTRLFTDYFIWQHRRHFMLNIFSILDGKKHFQRALLENNVETKGFNPDYFVFKKEQVLSALKMIRHVFDSKKIVIKSVGACGHGNLFFDLALVSDETMLKAIENRSYFLQEEQTIFTVEAQKMYSPLQEDVVRFPGHKQLGVYYRYLVFYYPSDHRIEFYPVYRNILDISRSMDSHSLDKSSNLEEMAYFLSETPETLLKICDDQKNNYPERYQTLVENFQKISKVFFEFTLKNQAGYIFSTSFIHWFHRDDPRLYYEFFATEAVKHVCFSDGGALAFKEFESFKLFFNQLVEVLSLNSHSNGLFIEIAQRKKHFLLLLSVGLMPGNTLTYPQLFLLRDLVHGSKKDVNNPFRALSHQQRFFSKKPCYGKTTTGDKAVKMLEDAIAKHKVAPMIVDEFVFSNIEVLTITR